MLLCVVVVLVKDWSVLERMKRGPHAALNERQLIRDGKVDGGGGPAGVEAIK